MISLQLRSCYKLVQNMIDLFYHEGVLNQLNQYVITGNYRYTYYKKHKKFFDELIEKEILSHFKEKKKIIFYAPTWMDLEESSSFFDCASAVLDSLPEAYNIIVKPHPQLELDNTTLYYQILGKYHKHPRIFFLTDFHLIYPILNIADIYLGDMSSIGYDFLVFNRPMFFLNKDNRNPKKDRRSYGASPVHGHVLPLGARRNAMLRVTQRLIVNPAANQAHPGFVFHVQ